MNRERDRVREREAIEREREREKKKKHLQAYNVYECVSTRQESENVALR